MTHRHIVAAQPANIVSLDRKSTRLNSSHVRISYAVFCLKKKRHRASPRRGIRVAYAATQPIAKRSRGGALEFRGPREVGEGVAQLTDAIFSFFNVRATPRICPLSLPDALPP